MTVEKFPRLFYHRYVFPSFLSMATTVLALSLYSSPQGLENEIVRSELTNDEVRVMQKMAQGLYTFKEFLAIIDTMRTRQSPTPCEEGVYALGICTDEYNHVCQSHHLCHFLKGHTLHGIPLIVHKLGEAAGDRIYLESITKTDTPIIFFVPPHLRSYKSDKPSFRGVTRFEMDWFLSHPHMMKNVTFVFGLYPG